MPFAVVILLMVGGMAAYVFYWQSEESRGVASHKLSNALTRLNSDFGKIQMTNRDLANKLSHESAFTEALSKEDRSAMSSIIKSASDARGFDGAVTAFDENGKVVYSSDTPARFGYGMRGKNNAVDYVFNNQDIFVGPTSGLSAAQSIALSVMVPIFSSNGQCTGIVAVSEPIDEAFLTGEAMKMALTSEPLSNIDFVLLGAKESGQIYITPTLLKDRPPYLQQLGEQGVKALPNWQDPSSWQLSNIFNSFTSLFNKNGNIPGIMAAFVKNNRFWQPFSLIAATKTSARTLANANEIVAVILATTPLTSEGIKPGFVIFASCIMGLAAIFSVVALSTHLATQPDSDILAFTERIKKWRADKRVPPTKKLTGAWQELSDLVDQTFIEWQNVIQGLKQQLQKTAPPQEGQAAAEQHNDAQFEALNRQLSNQSRQLSEFSRQLNQSNQQSVFLQNELEAILQSTAEGLLILDLYGNLIHANPIFLSWLGMSEAEIAGRFCFDLVKKPQGNGAGDNTGATPAFVKHEADPNALINQFFPEGVIHNIQTNKTVEVILHLQPVTTHDNKISGYILMARDKSLRSEITGLKMEIITMLARAVRAPLLGAEREWQNITAAYEQIKEHFPNIATVPPVDKNAPVEIHEQLNRELNQELKQVELTFEQKLQNLHSRYENLIKSVEIMLATHGEAIGQMIPLTSESGSFPALDLGSILATTEPVKESFPVSRVVSECLREVAHLASEKQMMLDYKTSTALPNITGDRTILKSILAPVIEKMINITDAKGKVRVETFFKDKAIQISVASSGPALPEDEAAEMFAGFDAEKHEEDTYGSRLALYLSRNNAERIGAKIWAQTETPIETQTEDNSQPGSEASPGTTVYITLPIA